MKSSAPRPVGRGRSRSFIDRATSFARANNDFGAECRSASTSSIQRSHAPNSGTNIADSAIAPGEAGAGSLRAAGPPRRNAVWRQHKGKSNHAEHHYHRRHDRGVADQGEQSRRPADASGRSPTTSTKARRRARRSLTCTCATRTAPARWTRRASRKRSALSAQSATSSSISRRRGTRRHRRTPHGAPDRTETGTGVVRRRLDELDAQFPCSSIIRPSWKSSPG